MKRLKQLPVVALALLLALCAATLASAEDTQAWRADLTSLLSREQIPATTTIDYDLKLPEGAQTEEKRHSVELVSSKGHVLNVEVTFELVNLPLSRGQWQEIEAWLKGLVTTSVQSVKAEAPMACRLFGSAMSDRLPHP